MNTVLILVQPCTTESKATMFWCFFLLYFKTCIGLTGHHQAYNMCSWSLLCFPFHVLDPSRCYIHVILRHSSVSNHVFGLCSLNMLSFLLVVYLLRLVLHGHIIDKVSHPSASCCIHSSRTRCRRWTLNASPKRRRTKLAYRPVTSEKPRHSTLTWWEPQVHGSINNFDTNPLMLLPVLSDNLWYRSKMILSP